MKVRVEKLDESYGCWYRVIGAASNEEAITAASETWLTDDRRLPEDDPPRFVVEESGWYRCIPCICGDGHRTDLWPADGKGRGAFYSHIIGMSWAR